jgi:hypothetical protein
MSNSDAVPGSGTTLMVKEPIGLSSTENAVTRITSLPTTNVVAPLYEVELTLVPLDS